MKKHVRDSLIERDLPCLTAIMTHPKQRGAPNKEKEQHAGKTEEQKACSSYVGAYVDFPILARIA